MGVALPSALKIVWFPTRTKKVCLRFIIKKIKKTNLGGMVGECSAEGWIPGAGKMVAWKAIILLLTHSSVTHSKENLSATIGYLFIYLFNINSFVL